MIKLLPRENGTYAEVDGTLVLDVAWVRDSYTEPRESLFDCSECEQPIEEWDLWTCLDGGDAAHQGCVEITSQDDLETLYEQPGALPGDGQEA